MRWLMVCLLCLLSFVATGLGADSHMVYYATGNTGNKFFYVTDTIKVLEDHTIMVASVCDYSMPKNGVNKRVYALVFNKEARQYKSVAVGSFNADGQLIETQKYPDAQWQVVGERTVYNTLLNKVLEYLEQHPKGDEAGDNKQKRSSGSGFFISPTLVVTNYHVAGNGKKLEVVYGGKIRKPAVVIASNQQNDLVLLKVEGLEGMVEPLVLANSKEVREGERIYAVGFPLSTYTGSTAKITDGLVNSISGFNGNPNQFQISAPVQPGNSGGPLLNEKGEVVGVVSATLNKKFADTTGVIAQNVNFAMKSNTVQNMLNLLPDRPALPERHNRGTMSTPDIMDLAKKGIVYIQVGE